MAAATSTKSFGQHHASTESSSSSSAQPPPLLPALSSFESVRRRLAYKDDVDDEDDATSVCTTNGTEVDFYSGSDGDDSDEDENNKSSFIHAVASQSNEVLSASNDKSDTVAEDDDDDGDLYDADGTCFVGVLFNAKNSSVSSTSDTNCSSSNVEHKTAFPKCFNGDNHQRVKTPTNENNIGISAGRNSRNRSSSYIQHRSKQHQKPQMPPCEPEFLWAHHVQTVFASPPPPALLPPLFTNGHKMTQSESNNQFCCSPSSVSDQMNQNSLNSDLSQLCSSSSCEDRASSAPVILPPHQQKPSSSQLPTTSARRKLIISKTFVAPSASADGNDIVMPALAAARAALLQQQQQKTFPPSAVKNQPGDFQQFYMLTPQSSESGGSSLNTTPTSLVTTAMNSNSAQSALTTTNGNENYRKTSTTGNSFTIMSPVEQQQVPSSSPSVVAFHDFATFDAYDMRLQQHVRFAIEQVREAAKLQVLQERNARRQTAFMRPRLAQFLPAGKYRFDRTLLSSLCAAGTSAAIKQRSGAPYVLSHLQLIVQELYDAIEKRNDELVQLLVLRDELSMEQDSILVDLQDLQRRVREKMLNKSTPRSAAPSKVQLPKSCSLTFSHHNQQRPAADRISSLAQRLFAKGMGRRTSVGSSGQHNSNAAYVAPPLPVSPVSSSTAPVQSSPLAVLGQRFFSLINFNSNSNSANVDKSKYQAVSVIGSNHSRSSSSSVATAAEYTKESDQCGETTSESGRENDRDVDDDDEDDDDYYYDED